MWCQRLTGNTTKPFVLRQSRLGLLRIFHDEIGIDKTLESIQRHFWFPPRKPDRVYYKALLLTWRNHLNQCLVTLIVWDL